jgi:hypothetical protein
MKRSVIIFVHLGFWLCYFILIGCILAVLFGSKANPDVARIQEVFFTLILFAVVPSAISFYGNYYLVFPRINKQKYNFTTILFEILIPLFSGLVGYSSLYSAFGDQCLSGVEGEKSNTAGLILFIAFISFISGVIALVIRGFITWSQELKLKESLKQKTHEMEMALVKSQLDPHFLFNTINNIDVLILKDQQEASDYLNKLSDIMRFMLFETKSEEIPLEKEIEYIEKYIELQKIRTANSNYINYSVTGDPIGKTISPMVFIPFIENAFKHTTNKKIDNAIDIKITISNKHIILDCNNKTDPNRKTEQESNGLGNQLIEKRLNLSYPGKHKLEISNQDNLYKVHLRISHG